MPSADTELPRLLTEACVPAAAAAFVQNDGVTRFVARGLRTVQGADVVDEHTVFDAASLSKPMFAHAVLQLVDQGGFALDAPLGDYLPNYVPIDPHASSITAADVLCHRTGLPNWRSDDYPLRTYFAPRDRFSYSGEGYLYLQRAVEAATGETAQALAERLVFEPFGMAHSSFVWHPRLERNRAWPHDAFGTPAVSFKPGEANAASSLQTTAADYAKFLCAVLDGSRLKPDTARLWLHPHIEIRHSRPQALEPPADDVRTGIAWGLGWGLEIDAGTFFHWGNNGAFKAFTVGSVQRQEALVVFANGASGLAIMPDLVACFMPGDRASLAWLDYGCHDAPVRRALRAALEHGVQAAWDECAGLDPAEMRWIVQGLNANGRADDSAWLRTTIDRRAAD